MVLPLKWIWDAYFTTNILETFAGIRYQHMDVTLVVFIVVIVPGTVLGLCVAGLWFFLVISLLRV